MPNQRKRSSSSSRSGNGYGSDQDYGPLTRKRQRKHDGERRNSSSSSSSSSRCGGRGRREENGFLVYVANVATESVDDESLKEYLIERFHLAWKKDLNVIRCIVRQGLGDAVVKCKHEADGRKLLRLKSRTLSGNSMEFVPWSSDWGDIDDFVRGAPTSSTHPSTSPSPSSGSSNQEAHRAAAGSEDDSFDHDLPNSKKERCYFKLRCGHLQRGPEVCKYFHTKEEILYRHPNCCYADSGGADVVRGSMAEEKKYKLHIANVVGATCDQDLHDFLATKFKRAFKWNLDLVRCHVRQNFGDAFIECENEDDCDMLLKLENRIFNNHTIKISRPATRTPSINSNDDDDDTINTTTNTTTTTAISNDDKHAMELRDDDDDAQKLLYEDTPQRKVHFVNTPDTIKADILNDKHRDNEDQKLHDEDTTKQKFDTLVNVSNDNDNTKHATLLRDHEALNLQYEYAMKQNIELTAEKADLKATHEETLSKYKNLKKYCASHSKVKENHAEIESLKRQAAESEYRCTKLTDTLAKQTGTICDVMQEKRDVTNRLEHEISVRQEAERVFEREYSELSQQLQDEEQKFDREKSELRKRLQEDLDHEKSELRKQLQNEFDHEKIKLRHQIRDDFDQEKNVLRNQLQGDEKQNVDEEISKLCKQVQDEIRGRNEVKQKYDEEKSKVRKQLDDEIIRRQEAEQIFHQEKSKLRKQLDDQLLKRHKAEDTFHQEKSELRKQLEVEIRRRQEVELKADRQQLRATYNTSSQPVKEESHDRLLL